MSEENVPTTGQNTVKKTELYDQAVHAAVEAYDDRSLFRKEPAVFIGAVVSLIVALGAIFGVVIDANTVTSVLTAAAPLAVGVLVRAHVIPAA